MLARGLRERKWWRSIYAREYITDTRGSGVPPRVRLYSHSPSNTCSGAPFTILSFVRPRQSCSSGYSLLPGLDIILGSLSNDVGNGSEKGKKAKGLDWQINNSARVAVIARLRRETSYFHVLWRT